MWRGWLRRRWLPACQNSKRSPHWRRGGVCVKYNPHAVFSFVMLSFGRIASVEVNVCQSYTMQKVRLSCRPGYIPSVISFSLNWAKLSKDLLDRFSRFFYQMEGICVNVVNPDQFFKFLMATNFGQNWRNDLHSAPWRSGILQYGQAAL